MTDQPHGFLRSREQGEAETGPLDDVPAHELAQALLTRLRRGESFTDDIPRVELFSTLGIELEQRLEAHSNRFSRTYARTLFNMFHLCPRDHGLRIPGSTFVEVGCGSLNPLSVSLMLVLLGAKRAVGIDLDALQDHALAARALARCASWMLTDPRLVIDEFPITREEITANLAQTEFDLAKLWNGDPTGLDESRVAFRQESVYELSFDDGEVDCVHSNSFFEHVPDLDGAIAELARITRKGGFGSHNVDGSDHMSHVYPDRSPLGFLTVDSDEPIVDECNRVRPLDYVPAFERHGFQVLHVEPYAKLDVDDAMRATFAEPFRSMSNEKLGVVGAMIYVRKT